MAAKIVAVGYYQSAFYCLHPLLDSFEIMDELEQLTALLNLPQKQRLELLEKRLNDTHQRSREIAAILPTAFQLAAHREEFITALQSTIELCIERSIQHTPEYFTTTLLPVVSTIVQETLTHTLNALQKLLATQQTEIDNLSHTLNALEQFQAEQRLHCEQLGKRVNTLKQIQINQQLELTDFKGTIKTLSQAKPFPTSVAEALISYLKQMPVEQWIKRTAQQDHIEQRLITLEGHFADPQQRALDIAGVLPEAIHQASQQLSPGDDQPNDPLTDALQPVVMFAFQQTMKDNIQPLADALFPLLGPAIRNFINQALKDLIQRINTTVGQGFFSARGISWRIQAWYTGQPFAEIVLSHTLVYRIEQVFLIHRESGLLIQHAHIEDIAVGDSSAVSAMFTAIQDFIRDSFSADRQEELDSVEVGQYTVWIERGPYALLACVIRGNAPRQFRKTMQALLERLHAIYKIALQHFSGDSAVLAPCQPQLEKLLYSETKSKTPTYLPILFWIFVLAMIFVPLTGWQWQRLQWQQHLQAYLEALHQTPGIVITSTYEQGDDFIVSGLRDALATTPQVTVPPQVKTHWAPFQDLTPLFIQKRAQHYLMPPQTVKLRVQDNVLYLTGYANEDWITWALAEARFIAGVHQVDSQTLQNIDQFLLAEAKRLLVPPQQVTLAVQARLLNVKGYVDEATWQKLQHSLKTLRSDQDLFAGYKAQQLVNAEQEIKQLKQAIEQIKLYFVEDDVFSSGQVANQQALLRDIRQLLKFSEALGWSTYIEVTGNTDGLGSEAQNRQLSQRRAHTTLNWLHAQGIAKRYLILASSAKVLWGLREPQMEYRNTHFRVVLDRSNH